MKKIYRLLYMLWLRLTDRGLWLRYEMGRLWVTGQIDSDTFRLYLRTDVRG